jgi:hypothetical protein
MFSTKFKACVIAGFLCLFSAGRPARAQEIKSEVARPRLAMNLSGPADWNTELPFADVFKLSREWISQREGAGWGKGPALELDEHGWVKRLDPSCWAETPMCTIGGGHYPSGRYTVLHEGVGELNATGAARVLERGKGKMTLDVDARKGGFFLQIRSTDPKNYVRNIRVLMPGQEGLDPNAPWNPAFLKLWKGVACLRFMDLMQTNGSKIRTWNDRPKRDDATWTRNGVPIEVLCDLANRVDADAWFCIPHQADDAYVKAFAKLVASKLDVKHKIYVEYSNEVWNGGFAQNKYAGGQGQRFGMSTRPVEAARMYTAYRSVQIFAICESEISKDRLVRVLASQAAVPYVSEQILGFRGAAKHADALAIAPYLSFMPSPTSKPSAQDVGGWTVEQVMDHVERVSLPQSIKWISDQKKVADKFGLPLIAYEGGQHLVGVGGGENVDSLTRVFKEANAHPRMEGIYARYFDAWAKNGGGLFCYFSSVGGWSKWGSWGLLQHLDDDPAASPKFRATFAWAKRLGQPVMVPGPSPR